MIRKTCALVALIPLVMLTGCIASPQQNAHPFSVIQPLKATPTTSPEVPIASGMVDTVYVEVFPGIPFNAIHGCRCTLKGTSAELFPAGTPVLVLRISLTGEWKPSQGDSTTQDVTGTELTGTKFDGRPEAAILDTADGPPAARALDLPWLPSGLFHGHSRWQIPNSRAQSFVAAWYLPHGVDQLILTVSVPAEGEPNQLIVPVPADALAMLRPDTVKP